MDILRGMFLIDGVWYHAVIREITQLTGRKIHVMINLDNPNESIDWDWIDEFRKE